MQKVHPCHAIGCSERVLPSRLMCPRHWFMVPHKLRREVWKLYKPGQEITKDPTHAYLAAAKAAIDSVAKQEGKSSTVEERAVAFKTLFTHFYGQQPK